MVSDLIRTGASRLTNSPEPLLDARVLLAHAAGCDNAALLFSDITQQQRSLFEKYIEMRRSGMPVAYILNKKEFMGYDFYVDENTLIPRPDTECLVERTLALGFVAPHILDLCTGSGCIGISLALMIANANAVLADISDEALNAANKNIALHGVSDRVRTIKINVLSDNFPMGFDIITANPPYIPSDEVLRLEVSKTEPHIALDGGYDGLSFYRIITEKAATVLNSGGVLVLEIGYNQKAAVEKLAKRFFGEVNTYKDYAGNDRVVTATNIKNKAIQKSED